MRALVRTTGATLTVACMLLSRAYAQAPADPAAPVVGPSPDGAPVAGDTPPPTGEETIVVPAEGAEEGGLSAAEMEALGFGGSGDAQAASVDTTLKFSGFMDFTSSVVAITDDNKWKGATDRYQSFFIGNFNLYISKNLTENVRSFGEVRFTYLPNGARTSVATSSDRINTQITDYNSFGAPLRWAGIQIQRAYLEWTFHKYITGRAGQYLTPYGIWNVDHGSPTIITVQRPYVVNIQLFPERQTGLEFYGRYDFGNEGLGYHLTLSNGNGPASEYRDLDRNKAVGGRVFWNHVGLGEMRVGGSLYYGRDTTSTEVTGIRPGTTNQLVSTETITNQFDQLNLALDLQWRYGGFHMQSEFITQQRKYTERGRQGAVFPLNGQFLAPNDTLYYGGYLLMGYRFEWLGIMPYAVGSAIKYTDPLSHFATDNAGILLGLNIRPIDAVVAKLEWAGGFFPWGTFYGGKDAIHYIQAQLAWAF